MSASLPIVMLPIIKEFGPNSLIVSYVLGDSGVVGTNVENITARVWVLPGMLYETSRVEILY